MKVQTRGYLSQDNSRSTKDSNKGPSLTRQQREQRGFKKRNPSQDNSGNNKGSMKKGISYTRQQWE